MKMSHLKTPRQLSDCYWRDAQLDTTPDKPRHWIAALCLAAAAGFILALGIMQ